MKSRHVTFKVTTPQKKLGITSSNYSLLRQDPARAFGNSIWKLEIKFKRSTNKKEEEEVKTNEKRSVVIAFCQF